MQIHIVSFFKTSDTEGLKKNKNENHVNLHEA